MTIVARKRGLLAALAGLALAAGAGVSYAHNPPPTDDPPPPVIEIPPPPLLPPPPPPIPNCTGVNCGETPPLNNRETPEPATLLSAAIGSSLAGLYGLRRRRKQAEGEPAA